MALRSVASGSASGIIGGGGASIAGGLIGQMQQQYASALASNQARYQATLAGYQAREQKVQDSLSSYGQNQLADSKDFYAQDLAKTQQDVARRGLSNTTIAGSAAADAGTRFRRDQERINNDIANTKANAYMQTSGQTLAYQGSYQDPYPSSATIAGLATSADSLAEHQREFNQLETDKYNPPVTRGGGGGGGGGSGGGGIGGGAGSGWLNSIMQQQDAAFRGPNNTYGYWPGGYGSRPVTNPGIQSSFNPNFTNAGDDDGGL